MSFVESEIVSQPACWRAAVDRARQGGLGLPEPGERIAVVGCGTSSFMAQAYAACREAAGHGWSDAFASSECPARPYDAVMVLSRSGTTTETLQVLDRFPGTRTVAVTVDGASPMAKRATHAVLLPEASERSVLQTRYATMALALLRASLGEDLTAAIADAERAVGAPLPAPPGEHRHVTFLGRGWTVALAHEAALKCREAAGAWTESYSAMEYRHGPLSAVTADSLVWSLGPIPAGLDREVADLGGTMVRSDVDPMADLIRAQRFAVALAKQARRDPDRPPGLEFSVLLGPDGAASGP